MPLPLLGYLHIATYFLPAALGAKRYVGLSSPMKLLSVLCIVAAINAVLSFILGRLGYNNQPLANAYAVAEFVLLIFVFRAGLRSRVGNRLLLGCAALLPIVWTLHQFLVGNLLEMNTDMALLSKGILVLISIFAMAQVLTGESLAPLGRRPMFWTSMAVMLYATGTFVVFGLGNYFLQTDVHLFVAAWQINWVLIITSNLLFTKALLCHP